MLPAFCFIPLEIPIRIDIPSKLNQILFNLLNKIFLFIIVCVRDVVGDVS